MKKILIVCSTTFYDRIKPISDKLSKYGYEVEYPNCYDEPIICEDNQKKSQEECIMFFKKMYKESRKKISKVDELLVLNFDKNKNGTILKNYIGASTFLEMYEAYMQNKNIYIFNHLPDNVSMLYDDIKGMGPICLEGNIEMINNTN